MVLNADDDMLALYLQILHDRNCTPAHYHRLFFGARLAPYTTLDPLEKFPRENGGGKDVPTRANHGQKSNVFPTHRAKDTDAAAMSLWHSALVCSNARGLSALTALARREFPPGVYAQWITGASGGDHMYAMHHVFAKGAGGKKTTAEDTVAKVCTWVPCRMPASGIATIECLLHNSQLLCLHTGDGHC